MLNKIQQLIQPNNNNVLVQGTMRGLPEFVGRSGKVSGVPDTTSPHNAGATFYQRAVKPTALLLIRKQGGVR